MKYLALLIFIFSIGGCIIWAVIANEDRKSLQKEYNIQFKDTPLYYKRYMETSVIYKYKH